VEKLRDEERFDSVDALLAQIHKDIDQTRAIVSPLIDSP
jgi:FAD synthase